MMTFFIMFVTENHIYFLSQLVMTHYDILEYEEQLKAVKIDLKLISLVECHTYSDLDTKAKNLLSQNLRRPPQPLLSRPPLGPPLSLEGEGGGGLEAPHCLS